MRGAINQNNMMRLRHEEVRGKNSQISRQIQKSVVKSNHPVATRGCLYVLRKLRYSLRLVRGVRNVVFFFRFSLQFLVVGLITV